MRSVQRPLTEESKVLSRGDRAEPPGSRTIAFVSAVVLAVPVLLLSGCGGSSGTSSSTSATRSTAHSAATTPSGSSLSASAGTASTDSASGGNKSQPSTETPTSHDKILKGKVVQGPAAGTGAGTINDDNSYQAAGRADTGKHKGTAVQVAGEIDPCSLVTRSKAEAIIGSDLEVPHEAPLGPTCIYQSRGSRKSVTVAVEIADFSKIQPHLRKVTKLDLRGHVGYCGTYGRSMIFVPLPDNTVLNVTAPCSVGQLMATAALAHLSA